MTRATLIISPGQGLLLLMEHYKDNKAKSAQLKQLYLRGAENAREEKKIKSLLQDPVLSSYKISYIAQTINNDPARRYFETHLAYESLTQGLNKIELTELEQHVKSLDEMVPLDKRIDFEHVLNGEIRHEDQDLFKEYADYIHKVKSSKLFPDLNSSERTKLELIIKSSFLAVMNAWYIAMPLNIYGTGIYSTENKGKIITHGQETTRSAHLGLMKSHMPLPIDDIGSGDEALPYLKPSDQASFIEKSRWVRSNFSKMVHPFSNSISGTMLCQLRAHAKLRNEGKSIFTASAKKMAQFSQLLTSAMLFNSGGHSLHEFTAPLSLKEVKKEFRSIPDFDTINLGSMYLTGNQIAYDAAIKDTLEYNKAIILKQTLIAEITNLSRVPTQKLSENINDLAEKYQQRIKNQLGSTFRAGAQKNILIQSGLTTAINQIANNEPDKALETIINLKKDFESKFGKTNFLGRKSASYQLLESVESSLSTLNGSKKITLLFKEKLIKEKLRSSVENLSLVKESTVSPK